MNAHELALFIADGKDGKGIKNAAGGRNTRTNTTQRVKTPSRWEPVLTDAELQLCISV